MTREERTNKLKHFITCMKCEVSGKRCDENCPIQYDAGNMGEIIENLEEISKILDMAIEALDQEPCEDCISRKAVKELFQEGSVMGMYHFLGIDELPSVTPARKKGKWCKQNDDYNDWYECSECGYGSEGEMQYSSEYDVRTNYCPQCGCKME